MAQSTENVNMLSVDTDALAAAQEMINSIVLQIGQIPETKKFSLDVAADISSIASVVLSLGQMTYAFIDGHKQSKKMEERFKRVNKTFNNLGDTIKSVAADLASSSKAIGEGIADGVSKGLKDGLKSVKMKTKELGEDGVIK